MLSKKICWRNTQNNIKLSITNGKRITIQKNGIISILLINSNKIQSNALNITILWIQMYRILCRMMEFYHFQRMEKDFKSRLKSTVNLQFTCFSQINIWSRVRGNHTQTKSRLRRNLWNNNWEKNSSKILTIMNCKSHWRFSWMFNLISTMTILRITMFPKKKNWLLKQSWMNKKKLKDLIIYSNLRNPVVQ